MKHTNEKKQREAKINEKMNIVIVGHVDHGKSTIIGRLLSDTGTLPEGKLEVIRENCRINSKPFEYAFLLDALKDEQAQGITIDAARVFFKTKKRHYIILDAPGHIEFLRNMITGAARAEAALLVIDAGEGIQENSRRHGYMLSLLGITQVAVVINKMDLINFSEEKFNAIVSEYQNFLKEVKIDPKEFIPVSGMQGDNISNKSARMKWYAGNTVLEALDSFQKKKSLSELPFRMPVQDVYKFTGYGDSRRIIAGTIESGKVVVGDEIIFYPSGKKSTIKSFEAFNEPQSFAAEAGYATGFTLSEQIYITRGEVAAKKSEPPPRMTTRILVSIFWLGHHPMEKNREYFVKLGTTKASAVLEDIHRIVDASTLQYVSKSQIEKHDVGECILKFKKPVAFDVAEEIAPLGRFVIIDNFEISGGGIIRENLPDKQTWVRNIVQQRNSRWLKSKITCGERAEKYNQKAALLLLTGSSESELNNFAVNLEKSLFEDGKIVYYIGLESIASGLDADIDNAAIPAKNQKEHLRRLGEMIHIFLDAGMIVIAPIEGLTKDDIGLIEAMVNPDFIEVISFLDSAREKIDADLVFKQDDEFINVYARIKQVLRARGIIYSPW
ncbi:MAG: GTP-binding protein [Spirochaetia bacterium]|nr:GTP-binding protein [Spirochaetia bacterium]